TPSSAPDRCIRSAAASPSRRMTLWRRVREGRRSMSVSIRAALTFVAALALGGCGGQKNASEWIERLKARDPALRLQAVNALGKSGADPQQAVPALTAALKD